MPVVDRHRARRVSEVGVVDDPGSPIDGAVHSRAVLSGRAPATHEQSCGAGEASQVRGHGNGIPGEVRVARDGRARSRADDARDAGGVPGDGVAAQERVLLPLDRHERIPRIGQSAGLDDADLNPAAVQAGRRREVCPDDAPGQVGVWSALLQIAVDGVDALIGGQLPDDLDGQGSPDHRTRRRRCGLRVELAKPVGPRLDQGRDLLGPPSGLPLQDRVDVGRLGTVLGPLAERSLGLREPQRDRHPVVVRQLLQVDGERRVQRPEPLSSSARLIGGELLQVDVLAVHGGAQAEAVALGHLLHLGRDAEEREGRVDPGRHVLVGLGLGDGRGQEPHRRGKGEQRRGTFSRRSHSRLPAGLAV